MRVVFDTNVIISATLFGGRPLEAVNLGVNGLVTPVTSHALLAELTHTMARGKFSVPPLLLKNIVYAYTKQCELVAPLSRISVLADEPDNRVLECAVEGSCEYLVTGDKALLALGAYKEVRIVTIDEFLSSVDTH